MGLSAYRWYSHARRRIAPLALIEPNLRKSEELCSKPRVLLTKKEKRPSDDGLRGEASTRILTYGEDTHTLRLTSELVDLRVE